MDTQLTNHRVVAIDGGTATGKGRLIEELSQLLRLKGVPVLHLSTGSLYRAVAVAALDKVLANDMSEALARVREQTPEWFLEQARQRHLEMHGGQVWLDGEVLPEERLKGPGAGTGASIVSVPLPVREMVNEIARQQVNEFEGYLLVDGRDIGHGVLPDAPLKLLLVVSPHIAAERSREHSLEEIVARDRADQNRPHGALKTPEDPGEGVQVLPTDDHSPESLRDEVYELMQKVFPELPTA